ncbi:MAG: hypothetical protein IPI58_07360 [Alphaproteobacteria bacterium]|nr:MAG: hypothetical protein IPI58_07360 [Alphaproteobacteria bacterium]
MNALRTLSLLACFLMGVGSLAQAAPARAAITFKGAAPLLYGIGEVVLHPAVFVDESQSATCNVSPEIVSQSIRLALKNSPVPLLLEESAPPIQPEIARVHLLPVVVSLYDHILNCTSWINLTVEAEHVLRLPPVGLRKEARVIYWEKGIMLTSPISVHDTVISKGFRDLSLGLVKGWNAAQPSKSDDLDSPKPPVSARDLFPVPGADDASPSPTSKP